MNYREITIVVRSYSLAHLGEDDSFAEEIVNSIPNNWDVVECVEELLVETDECPYGENGDSSEETE